MDLILWRHAEAEERRPGLPDERRRLTPKGEKQARKMAKWLKKRLPKNTRILVSPTERTKMTAHALGMPFEIERKIGPGAEADDLLTAAGWPDDGGTVLLVGHQPTFGQLAARLFTGDEDEWSIKKGGVWWLTVRAQSGGRQIELRAVVGPGLL